jgi:Tfp pilus assembly protein PilN
MSERRFLDPNLASRPFENTRPVERLSALLWVLGLLVGGAALWLAADARRQSGERQLALDRLVAEATEARENASRLRAELERADLVEQNIRTEFLNERIAERAFSWNDLFDTLAEVLPRGVRIQDLSPLGFGPAERTTARQARPKKSSSTALVNMRISGVAEDTESLLNFVDRLYGHPAFAEPNLAHEVAQRGQELDFTLSVGYLPGLGAGGTALAATQAAVPAAEGTGPPAGNGGPGATGSGDAAAAAAPAAGALVPAPNPERPAVAGSPAAPGAITPRYRPGATTAPREGTSRYGAGGDASDEKAAAEARATAPGARNRGAATGLPGGVAGAPLLPAPLKPFASGPEPIR